MPVRKKEGARTKHRMTRRRKKVAEEGGKRGRGRGAGGGGGGGGGGRRGIRGRGRGRGRGRRGGRGTRAQRRPVQFHVHGLCGDQDTGKHTSSIGCNYPK